MKKTNQSKRKKIKIGWINHLIGFVSVLLGIFIAFQLNNWQQNASQRKNINTALRSIKQEVENNMAIYLKNKEELSHWLEYVSELQSSMDANGNLVIGEKALNNFMEKNPNRFDDLEYIGRYNDSLNIYQTGLKIDIMPESGISTSSWDAANSTGILNSIDFSTVAILTRIYDWTTKEIGINDAEIYNQHFLRENELLDLNTLVRDYNTIVSASRLKYQRIELYYNQMDWNP